jgi:hypothetical protein
MPARASALVKPDGLPYELSLGVVGMGTVFPSDS